MKAVLATSLDLAPRLTWDELNQIKIPVDLFDQIPIEFCRKHKILPLRLELESGSFSFAFVHPNSRDDVEEMGSDRGWMRLFAFRIDEGSFQKVLTQCEINSAAAAAVEFQEQEQQPQEEVGRANEAVSDPSMTEAVAIIEPNPHLRQPMEQILKLQNFGTHVFESEKAFFDFVERASNLQKKEISEAEARWENDDSTPEEKLLMLADLRAAPFQYVVARHSALESSENPTLFSERLWKKLPRIEISILEDNWLKTRLLEQAFRPRASDDLSFFLEHEDYYHAALECLKTSDLPNAVHFLERVKPDNAYFTRAKTMLGKLFLKKRNFNKAAQNFQEAYDHWCDDPDAHVDENVLKLLYHLGYSFEKLSRLDDALKLYERLQGENPLFREIGTRVARVREALRKANAAQEKKMGLPAFSKAHRENARYEKMEELGRGGMGIVYRARDLVLGREVALKVLNSLFKHDDKIVETFLREAKSLAALNHLHIVTVYDAGIEDGNYYISMEYIEGKTVRDLLKKRGHFSLATALNLSKQVLAALSYAHSKKVIHRDITTNNMMLTEAKTIKLMDFGLARVVMQLHSEQSIIGGTPYFMSPEQVEGAPIDHRTDIYSFGVCLFEMTTGQVPFPMENPGYHHLHTPAPDARKIKPELPVELSKVIAKCLQKSPDSRYASAEELLVDLGKIPLPSSMNGEYSAAELELTTQSGVQTKSPQRSSGKKSSGRKSS